MNTRQLVFAIVVVLLAIGWATRYEYVVMPESHIGDVALAPSLFVVNRWTGRLCSGVPRWCW